MGSTTIRECGKMNYIISYVEDGEYLLVEITGGADVETMKELVKDVLQHPNWHETIPGLIDFRGFSATDLTSDDIFDLAALVKSMGESMGSGNCALVMSKELDYGLARMWQMMTEEHVEMEIDVFMSIDEAKDWVLSK